MCDHDNNKAPLKHSIAATAKGMVCGLAVRPGSSLRGSLMSKKGSVLRRLVLLFGLSAGYAGSAIAECTTDELPSTDTVQSVEKVFDEVSRRWGQMISAHLTARGIGNLCIWVYELKLLSSSGEVTNVVYDASKLRMIGFNAPQVAAEESDTGVLRSIGQRFGFFGRRDPTSEGRGDSDRGDGDGQSTASSSNDGSSTDSDSTNDPATDSDTADASGGTDGKGGPSSSADEGAGDSGQSGSSSGAGSSGSSSNSSGSTGSSGG